MNDIDEDGDVYLEGKEKEEEKEKDKKDFPHTFCMNPAERENKCAICGQCKEAGVHVFLRKEDSKEKEKEKEAVISAETIKEIKDTFANSLLESDTPEGFAKAVDVLLLSLDRVILEAICLVKGITIPSERESLNSSESLENAEDE